MGEQVRWRHPRLVGLPFPEGDLFRTAGLAVYAPGDWILVLSLGVSARVLRSTRPVGRAWWVGHDYVVESVSGELLGQFEDAGVRPLTEMEVIAWITR